MRTRRALLIMPEYVNGGAETQFRYFIQGAEKRGCKLDVIVQNLTTKKASKELVKDKKTFRNVRIVEFHEYGASEKKKKYDIIRYLLKNIVNTKYESCLMYSAPNLFLVPILRNFGIKTIYSERGGGRDVRADARMLECIKLCDEVVANSEYSVKILKKITGKNIRLIRNGVPKLEILPKRESRNIKRILVPGRISVEKNPSMLIQYLLDFPETDVIVVFAGGVRERGYQKKMEGIVKKHNLQSKVIFMGHVSALKVEFQKADLIVLPSKSEGTPNVVLEAYGYGRPVIVSDIEAERNIVQDDRLRFKLNNSKELHQCIKYIEAMPKDEYIKMLEDNKKFVENNYSIDNMINAYCTLLQLDCNRD